MSINPINVFLINRNLLTTTKNTLDFLRKEKRVKVYILDQQSTYVPLLDYYKTIKEQIFYNKNEGPYSAWDVKYRNLRRNNFIVADSDCLYDKVPSNWLDIMINTLEESNVSKVGFSLEIENLPDSQIGKDAYIHESKYWMNKNKYGWDAHVDTTFAMYKPYCPFTYDAIRLDKPYCIEHSPWYITEDNISEEWIYYLKNASSISTWGFKLKNHIKSLK
tara:strand:- start:2400 stop:3056 length:657 start_codon:yes stop_codon:yes gene_type:complete